MTDQPPVACDLGALDEEQRSRRAELFARFQGAVRSVKERDDGYEVALEGTPIGELDELIGYENRCCPFLTFRVEEDGAALHVTITGSAGAKEFLRAEFGL